MSEIFYKKPNILQDLARLKGHVVIEASAGTGKTYTLEHLVVELLLSDPDCSLENILIVTFTRRATAELRDRVRGILATILRAYQDGRCAGNDEPENRWRIDASAAARIRSAMLAFDEAEIFTIHSFCQKILTDNAFQNNQLFELEMADEEALFNECWDDLIREKISDDETLRGWLDAWMHPKINGKLDALRKTLFKVFNAGAPMGYSARKSKSKDDKTSLSAEEVEARLFGNPEDLIRAASGEKYPDNSPHQADWRAEIIDQLLEVIAQEIDARKKRDGLYTFADMLKMVEASLGARDTSLRDAIRAQYRYALIDEFQDTDPTQWEIFRRLFVDPPPAQSGANDAKSRLFLIGDPKQAIYKFRGADIWTYLAAVEAIKTLEGAQNLVDLAVNYRSTEAMVQAYNQIFEQKRPEESRFFSNDKINYKTPVAHNPNAHRIRRSARPEQIPPAITVMRVNEGKKNDILPRWQDWMLTEIEQILWGDERFEASDPDAPGGWREIDASDIYVLTNSNAEAIEVGRLLGERGIPYAFYRQDGLFQAHEASDILTLLEGIARPGRIATRRAALRTPFFAVPMRDLVAFDESPGGERALKQLLSWRALARDHQFNQLFHELLNESGLLARELLFADGERGITNYQHLFELLIERAAQGSQDLEDLIDWLAKKVGGDDEEKDAEGEEDLQRLETDRPAVQVMTMHKSKGLQAHVVFVYGGFSTSYRTPSTFIDSELPDEPDHTSAKRVTVLAQGKSYLSDAQKACVTLQNNWDSERLMYVAITRAKSRLYLCYGGPDIEKFRGQQYGRGGRHAALARSLDALYAADSSNEQFRFLDVGEPGSHPGSCELEEVVLKEEQVAKIWHEITQASAPAVEPRAWGELEGKRRWVTAFSSVKKHRAPNAQPAIDEEEAPEEDEQIIFADSRFEEDTPRPYGGAIYGTFLHNTLEDLGDYADVLQAASAEDWLELNEGRAGKIFLERSKKDRVAAKFIPFSARILFDTLRAPIKLPGFKTPASIAEISARKVPAHEIDFHFPMPEKSFELGSWPDDAPAIKRGWIKGSIDLTFEHEEAGKRRIFIADWKSNQVPDGDFSPQKLNAYANATYALQARLYTLAAVKMLGIKDEASYEEKFGGCAYFFLRAMRPAGEDGVPINHGVTWCRPSWAELIHWQDKLRASSGRWNDPVYWSEESSSRLSDEERAALKRRARMKVFGRVKLAGGEL